MSMLKKSSSKTPTQMLEKPVVEEEKPSPAPKKRSNEIDEIFSAKKRKKREQENSEKLKEDVSEKPKKKKKKKSKGAKDVGFVDPSPRPRKRTEDGLTIYAEEELGIGKADAGGMASIEETETINNGRKNKRNCEWSKVEDDKLVESLYDMFLSGRWKADTGFKSGYLKEIETMMKAKLPGCGLKGNPHIDSRIRTLKKQTMAIAEMLNTGSGFGWDHEKHTIVCEQSVFDNWCLGHPNACGLYGRSFPHFDTLNAIYSKDRANGKGATAPAAEEEELEAGEFEEGENIANSEAATDGKEISDAHTWGSTTESVRKCSKKNTDVLQTGMTEICGAIHKLVDGTLEYLKEVGRAMNDDTTPSRAVAKVLNKMDILTLPKVCAAAKVITTDEYMTSIFLELPLEKQTEMVIDILKI